MNTKAAVENGGPAQYTLALKKSMCWLSKDNFDSAKYYLKAAYNKGMPKDSFLFLSAKIYTSMGFYDTALALNYSIKAPGTHQLYSEKYKQRSEIFTLLGLHNEAEKALDSAGSDSNTSFSVPSFLISLGGGFFTEKTIVNGTRDSVLIGPEYDIKMKGKWDLPWPRKNLFTISFNYANSRSNTGDYSESDSLMSLWGGSLGINKIAEKIYFNYDFSRKSTVRMYTSNSFQLSYLTANDAYDFIRGVSLLYSFDYRKLRESNDLILIDAFIQKEFVWNQFSLSLSAYYYGGESSSSSYGNNLKRIIINDKDSGAHMIRLELDPQGNYSKVPQDDGKYMKEAGVKDTSMNLRNYYIPNSLVTVCPSFEYSLSFTNNFKVNYYMDYNFIYYVHPCIWSNFSEDKDPNKYIAFDTSDQSFYYIADYDTEAQTFLSLEKEKRRIDNTIVFSLSFDWNIQKFGVLSLGCTFKKTFSNFESYSPFNVQDWSLDIQSLYSIHFPL